jgi:hypothetical protein
VIPRAGGTREGRLRVEWIGTRSPGRRGPAWPAHLAAPSRLSRARLACPAPPHPPPPTPPPAPPQPTINPHPMCSSRPLRRRRGHLRSSGICCTRQVPTPKIYPIVESHCLRFLVVILGRRGSKINIWPKRGLNTQILQAQRGPHRPKTGKKFPKRKKHRKRELN